MPKINKCELCGKVFKDKKVLHSHFLTHTGERPYSCDICNASFRNKSYLSYHQEMHKARPYQCHICKKLFSSEYKCEAHVRNHTEEKPHHCIVCGARFLWEAGLVYHMRAAHTGEKPFVCELCDSRFASKGNLKEHLMIHSDERPYKCEKCDASFRKLSSLCNHASVHSDERPYVCEVCGTAVKTKTWLNQHIKKLHTNVNKEVKFRCKCARIYKTQAELDAHYQEVHNTECKICKRVFAFPRKLKEHYWSHTGEMPFECEVCLKRYRHQSSLFTHMKRTHKMFPRNGRFQCSKCFKKFSCDSELCAHEAIHKNETQFKCNICQSYFRLRIILKHHLRTHVEQVNAQEEEGHTPKAPQIGAQDGKVDTSGNGQGSSADKRPHACEKCLRAFKVKAELKKHIKRMHTDIKFRCKCSKGFKTQAELDVHFQEVHNTECEICQRVFPFPQKLREHYWSHTGEMPFECEVCLKRYQHQSSLLTHMKRTHKIFRRNGRFQCPKCFKKFSFGSELLAHEAIHKNETQFKCNICQSYFRLRINLKHHLRTHVEQVNVQEGHTPNIQKHSLRTHVKQVNVQEEEGHTSNILKHHLQTHVEQVDVQEEEGHTPKAPQIRAQRKKRDASGNDQGSSSLRRSSRRSKKLCQSYLENDSEYSE